MLIAGLFALLASHATDELASIRVLTDCGEVKGKLESDSVAVFKGIPYAAPPVGKLRWSPPISPLQAKPPTCWSGTLDASDWGNSCVQFGGPEASTGEEDCLMLNVWAPQGVGSNSSLPKGPLPVLVFFYGGDLTQGKTAWYDMQLLAQDGPVVCVSVNYRLNVFGFLATQELSEADPRKVSGNYGFMDQQLALRWVQTNIGAFGGDAHRVTIFGQSSGGTSVLALLASPASVGLFASAISLSGSPNITGKSRNQV
jgi:para-nitrobenzyl esterase